MKNAVMYYYSINPDNILKNSYYYKIFSGDDLYVLSECFVDEGILKNIWSISQLMINYGVNIHQIISNSRNSLTTIIDEKKYVLMKINIKNRDVVTINDIKEFEYYNKNIINNYRLEREEWRQLWADKIDYFEYQISQFGKKYPIIRESISYYIGLAETAITLLASSNAEKSLLPGITHRRLKRDSTLFDLYNPLNLIVDNQVRDSSEFFKDRFFISPSVYDEVLLYLNEVKLSKEEMTAFYARMLYPSYYFDLYEEIINSNGQEKRLIEFIDRVDEYELFLKNLYSYIRKVYGIDQIEWIIKT